MRHVVQGPGKPSLAVDGVPETAGANGGDRDIAGCLDPFSRWLYDLHDTVRRGGSPAQVMAVACRLIPYQMVLFDGSFALMAYEANGQETPPSMHDVLEHGFAMRVSAGHQDEYRRAARGHPEGFGLEFDGDADPVPLWVRPLQTRSGGSYFLHVMGMREADADARTLVDELALELADALERIECSHASGVHDGLVQTLVTIITRRAR